MDEERVEVEARDAARKIGDTVSNVSARGQATVQGMIEKGSAVAQDLSAAGTRVAAQTSEIIKSVARDATNQAGDAATALYRRGANTGEYVSRYVTEQPLTALLIAAAFGYGIAYLIHRR